MPSAVFLRHPDQQPLDKLRARALTDSVHGRPWSRDNHGGEPASGIRKTGSLSPETDDARETGGTWNSPERITQLDIFTQVGKLVAHPFHKSSAATAVPGVSPVTNVLKPRGHPKPEIPTILWRRLRGSKSGGLTRLLNVLPQTGLRPRAAQRER